MKLSRTIGTWIVAGLVPVAMVLAQGTGTSGTSRPAADQPAAMGHMMGGQMGSMMGNQSGHMMGNQMGQMMGNQSGNQMMTLNGKVGDLFTKLNENLAGLQSSSDVDAIHAKVTQQKALIEQLEGTLNGQCGMSMGTMSSHMQNGQMMMGGGMSGSQMQPSDAGSSAPQEK